MKKYLFGVFAIALAIGLSSFTTRNTTAVLFQVSDPSSQQAVNDPTAWLYVGEQGATCTQDNPDFACELLVDPADLEGEGAERTINALIVITSESNGDGKFRVTEFDGSTEEIYNQEVQ